MKIIISPAKKMNVETDTFPVGRLPHFLEEAEYLKNYMKSLSYAEAKNIWNCNDKIAELNYERFRHMNLERGLTPAILSYEGIQYQYMAPMVMEAEALKYLEEHLRILSGFYGVLKPFDGVTPYRLEMQAKLEKPLRCSGQCTEAEGKSITVQEEKKGGVAEEKSIKTPEQREGRAAEAGEKVSLLYSFWGSKLYEYLEAEEAKERDTNEIFKKNEETESRWILNLASKEYSKCIAPYAKGKIPLITCVFGELVDGRVKEKGTLAKMARGEMVRFLAEHGITDVEGVKEFRGQGYIFRKELSAEDKLVFIK